MHTDELLIAIGGATGSGKTALALALAKKFPQLVILSADSRQIYKKLDIGSAKVGVPGRESELTGSPEPVWVSEGVPQYLIDIAEPGTTFSLAAYQAEAYRLIKACWRQGKVPLLVGGTGLYVQAVTEGYVLAGGVSPSIREQLEDWSAEALEWKLRAIGGEIAATDIKNKRRLIRAIERTLQGGKKQEFAPLTPNVYTFALQRDWEEQRELAPAMVRERLELGLIGETKKLIRSGLSKDWLEGMGLSYRLALQMLDGVFPESELETRMVHAFRQLMRRQRTWFNRMPHAQQGDARVIEGAVTKLLTQRP